MITRNKLDIYRRYDGSEDGFARCATREERVAITDQDWHELDELRQRLWLVGTGAASGRFAEDTRMLMWQRLADESLIAELLKIADWPSGRDFLSGPPPGTDRDA